MLVIVLVLAGGAQAARHRRHRRRRSSRRDAQGRHDSRPRGARPTGGECGNRLLERRAGERCGRRRAGRRPDRRPVRRGSRHRALRPRLGCRERRPGRSRCGGLRARQQTTFSRSLHGRRGSARVGGGAGQPHVGRTTVATFQVGRRFSGAADNVGFAVSSDNGSTWRSGLLPGLTRASVPVGPNERASDPVVAYDAVNRVWLIATLALESPDDAPDGQPLDGRCELERAGHGDRGLLAERNHVRQELDRMRQRLVQPTSRTLLSRLHRHAPRRPARGDHVERRRKQRGRCRSESR